MKNRPSGARGSRAVAAAPPFVVLHGERLAGRAALGPSPRRRRMFRRGRSSAPGVALRAKVSPDGAQRRAGAAAAPPGLCHSSTSRACFARVSRRTLQRSRRRAPRISATCWPSKAARGPQARLLYAPPVQRSCRVDRVIRLSFGRLFVFPGFNTPPGGARSGFFVEQEEPVCSRRCVASQKTHRVIAQRLGEKGVHASSPASICV